MEATIPTLKNESLYRQTYKYQVQVREYPERQSRTEGPWLLEDTETGLRQGKGEACGLSGEEHECPEESAKPWAGGKSPLLPPAH